MEALLELFNKIADTLSQLAELDREKADAVRKDDLLALDDVMKREQVITLTVRGLEQKRVDLLTQFGLLDVPLDAVPDKFPPDQRLRAKSTVERLQREYQVYRTASQVARDILECNLHEIEKILANAGVEQTMESGYKMPDVEPPASMKTDFHA